tara:strand:+ start:383 stop:1099 length:717 start_codon:yes stop_codon:yes gene_type:complete
MDIRQFFFKYRSYTPIPILLLIIYHSGPTPPYILNKYIHIYAPPFYIDNKMIGLALIALGEFIRLSAVRYAGGATRTRNVGAPFLCTSGPYSLTRNPLYCGNVIIYIGTVFFAGGIWMWDTLPFVTIFFIFQYYHIISLEEETLKIKFMNQYELYFENVPQLFPRFSPWKGGNQTKPKNLISTLKTEKRTLQNIFVIVLIIIYKKQLIPFFTIFIMAIVGTSYEIFYELRSIFSFFNI